MHCHSEAQEHTSIQNTSHDKNLPCLPPPKQFKRKFTQKQAATLQIKPFASDYPFQTLMTPEKSHLSLLIVDDIHKMSFLTDRPVADHLQYKYLRNKIEPSEYSSVNMLVDNVQVLQRWDACSEIML
jgi:hypothetical protein